MAPGAVLLPDLCAARPKEQRRTRVWVKRQTAREPAAPTKPKWDAVCLARNEARRRSREMDLEAESQLQPQLPAVLSPQPPKLVSLSPGGRRPQPAPALPPPLPHAGPLPPVEGAVSHRPLQGTTRRARATPPAVEVDKSPTHAPLATTPQAEVSALILRRKDLLRELANVEARLAQSVFRENTELSSPSASLSPQHSMSSWRRTPSHRFASPTPTSLSHRSISASNFTPSMRVMRMLTRMNSNFSFAGESDSPAQPREQSEEQAYAYTTPRLGVQRTDSQLRAASVESVFVPARKERGLLPGLRALERFESHRGADGKGDSTSLAAMAKLLAFSKRRADAAKKQNKPFTNQYLQSMHIEPENGAGIQLLKEAGKHRANLQVPVLSVGNMGDGVIVHEGMSPQGRPAGVSPIQDTL